MVLETATKVTEWAATVGIVLGAFLLAWGFPFWSALSYFLGSICWTAVALIWRKKSLFTTNAVIVLIYLSGYIREYLL